MGDSNGSWGEVVQEDTELGDVWDRFERLPDTGVNEALDALLEKKHITIESLMRLGAKLAEPQVLAFAYEGGIKFRDTVTGKRWSYIGSTWATMRIIRGSEGKRCIVAEGETDAARLTILYPEVDVAVMPAGALHFPSSYAKQLEEYELIYVGLDADEVGERGSAQILDALPQAMRLAPPANDWCETQDPPPLPDELERPPEALMLVPAGAMLQLEVPEQASWFEQELLPIGGSMIVHGWAKSYKTFTVLDIMAALAEGSAWCGFETIEEPIRVAVMQWEVPWKYYRDRIAALRDRAYDKEAFDHNFHTYTPLVRPKLIAGNTKLEDAVLRTLVEGEVQVVLLDPIRRATGAIDMNSEQDVRKILGFFQRVNDEGITVIATHHDNKSSAKAGGGDSASMTGSGAFAGDADTIVSVGVPPGDTFRTSKRRNLYFELRNGPTPSACGMEMTEQGYLLYNTEPFGFEAEPDEDGAATPAI